MKAFVILRQSNEKYCYNDKKGFNKSNAVTITIQLKNCS